MSDSYCKGNIFSQLPDASQREVFEPLSQSTFTHIERIVTQGQVTPEGEWYNQARAEWVLLLQGRARLRFASGDVVELNVGDHIEIPAHCKHRVDWTDENEVTLWLAMHYD